MVTADLCGLVLAGGKGLRLGGANKALLDVGGRTTLERVVEALRQLQPADLVLVTNEDVLPAVTGARVILDRQPHAGVLPGLLVGLEATTAAFCASAACDMPFLSAPLYRHLLSQADAYDVVIPEIDGRLEPMCAVYRRVTCAEAVRDALARGERRMVSFLGCLRVQRVPEAALREISPDLRALFNVNTYEDLELARALAQDDSHRSRGIQRR